MATRIDSEEFPRWLRQMRAARGWTQEDAARELGAKFTTYRKWEAGTSEPGMRAFLRIVDVYGWPDNGRSSDPSTPEYLSHPGMVLGLSA